MGPPGQTAFISAGPPVFATATRSAALEPQPSRDTPDVAAAPDSPWPGDSLAVGLSVHVSVRVR